jgi:endogenous inhibitor of DNA gyrase (YacG/DUF329 family)
MKSDKKRQVDCPTCQTRVVWSTSNQYRPFCSERCKLIDLGDWASEKHSIAGEPVYPDVIEDSDSVQ